MKYDYIGTYTNKKFYFNDPKPEQVCIEDIAQALSNQCRFSGHVSQFYSVAEHSALLAEIVYNETGDAQQALDALLHDASEAYLVDVPRPIKPHLENYFQMEEKIEKVIQEKFNINPMNDYIKHLDTHIVGSEAKRLFKHIPEWCYDFDEIEIDYEIGVQPHIAKEVFLIKFVAYKDYLNG